VRLLLADGHLPVQLKNRHRRQFKVIARAAGLGDDWTPQELRHTFVSLLWAGGTPVEEIARLAGHTRRSRVNSTITMSTVPQLRS
jgi:integrase